MFGSIVARWSLRLRNGSLAGIRLHGEYVKICHVFSLYEAIAAFGIDVFLMFVVGFAFRPLNVAANSLQGGRFVIHLAHDQGQTVTLL